MVALTHHRDAILQEQRGRHADPLVLEDQLARLPVDLFSGTLVLTPGTALARPADLGVAQGDWVSPSWVESHPKRAMA